MKESDAFRWVVLRRRSLIHLRHQIKSKFRLETENQIESIVLEEEQVEIVDDEDMRWIEDNAKLTFSLRH